MSKFVHALTLVRPSRNYSSLDDYGQPAEGTPTETSVVGLVQPQRARETDDSRSAGAEIADHVIFLPIIDVETTDAFIDASGSRYEVLGVRRFDYGRLRHLEVDCRRVDGVVIG